MDTDLKDPRGKIRCIQQAEEERKIQTWLDGFGSYKRRKQLSNGLYLEIEIKGLDKLNDEKGVKQ